MRHKNHTKL